MAALHGDLFMDEESSPLAETVSAGTPAAFERITFGDTFYLAVSGNAADGIDFWDRLRRSCIANIDAIQRRYPSDTPLGLEDDKAGEEA